MTLAIPHIIERGKTMTVRFFKLLYKDMHVLSTINNLQPIIDEVTQHGITINKVDDLFNVDIMKDYKLLVD